MSIDFLHPWFLILLLLVPLAWFAPRRVDRLARGVLRSLLFVSVITALAGPVLLWPEASLHQVFVLDRSASVGASRAGRAAKLLDAWHDSLDKRSKGSLVLVGAPESGGPDLPSDLTDVVQIAGDASGSPIGAALAAAERQIPEGSTGVVTLVSDGLATDRRWGPAVQRLIERGIPVAAYDLGVGESDVRPVNLATDPLLRVGQTARVTVSIAGKAAGARVRLTGADGAELAMSVPADVDGRADVTLEFIPKEPGFQVVSAEVVTASGKDSDPSDNTLRRTLAIQAPLRLLYLGDRMKHGGDRLGELLGRGFRVEDGSEKPVDAGTDLEPYDLVFVDDRPASRVPEVFQTRLSEAVRRDGLGLVFSGGKASFGTGGYDRSPIAGLLPVDFVQRTEKRDPSTALAVIIDTSGSMMGTRIELAKQVVRLAVRRLKSHDRVGIVEFYGNKNWALPMQSAANKIAIDRAIGRMQATGGTIMYPAIEEAYYGLKNVSTRYKHILIITDAGIEDADYESLVRLITKDNVNVSTVLVGSQAHSQSLIDIASWGHGRYYAASDRFALPEVVLKQATTTNLPAYKNGVFPVVGRGGPGWWNDVDRGAVPGLDGYVETQARPGAEVLMEVEGTGHPVLASWQYGLGRVTAFMTEPTGEGTADWNSWHDYGRWLARVASRTVGDTRPFRFDVRRDDQRIIVEASRYGDRRGATPRASVLGETGDTLRPLEFRQVSPDRFVAETIADPRVEVRIAAGAVDVSGRALSGAAENLVSSPAADVSPEKQVDPSQALDLAALARATSGMHVDASHPVDLAKGPVPRASPSSLSLLELWPYATLIALILFLAELAYRRWPRTT